MIIETFAGHDLTGFASGAAELDDWLLRRAVKAHEAGDAVVRVAVMPTGRVVGFHALCTGSLERSLAAGPLRRNAPDPVPVLVLARLAVDLSAQGHGVGVLLLADVSQRSIAAATMVGFRALVIHSRNEKALEFYRRWLPVESLSANPLHVYVPIRRLAQ